MASFFSRLFGSSKPAAQGAILHNDFRIFAAPIKESSGFRIAARVEKDFGSETKVHQLIRADTRTTMDEAAEASVAKAKQAIDQLGDTIFG